MPIVSMLCCGVYVMFTPGSFFEAAGFCAWRDNKLLAFLGCLLTYLLSSMTVIALCTTFPAFEMYKM